MSFHRATFAALAVMLTAGTTSVAFGCCGTGFSGPVVYATSGCGGCGAPAPIAYVPPPPPPPPPVAVPMWGAGCGCGRGLVFAAPALAPTPVAPAPIYVVNQGPDYTGPGLMVPYRTWSPEAAYAPAINYPYVPAYHPYYRARFAYHRAHAYGHPGFYGPMPHWRPYGYAHRRPYGYPHRPLGARD